MYTARLELLVTERKFFEVNLDSLVVGALADRPLFVYLPRNDRYVPLVKALYPLEEKGFSKIKKFGKVFSTQPPIEDRFPALTSSARTLRALCDDDALAPFEKSRSALQSLVWLSNLLGTNDGALAAVFLIHRAFGVPKPATLGFVTDVSVELYDRSLKTAAYSGIFALFLGYLDSRFVQQFVESVFCVELGRYMGVNTKTVELVKSGIVPGVEIADARFLGWLERERILVSDEALEIVEYARSKASNPYGVELAAARTRVARKLLQSMRPEARQTVEKEAA